MVWHISTNDGVPIYLQIVNQVKYLVASGALKVDDQLPAVRKLAEELLVNPNTVARAYRELENEGVVQSRRGSGVFITNSGSPLSKREQQRILCDRIDALLAESRQMGIDIESLMKLIRQRSARLASK